MAHLLYGVGLRLMELARMRVQDVDFQMNCVMVRYGKRAKDRITLLPDVVKEPLRLHLENVKSLHKQDIAAGHGEVYMPESLDRKYPNAGKDWGLQYVFPSGKLSLDPRSANAKVWRQEGHPGSNPRRGAQGRHCEACNRSYPPSLCRVISKPFIISLIFPIVN